MSAHGKEAVRLCEHIVRDAFGDVVCRVASTLLNRGRLAAFSVARLSGLPRPTTLSALIVLIQHNLVQSNGASYKATGGEEMYEFNVNECLLRLRWGRILAITQERIGTLAVEVVRQIMIYGKLKVPDVIAALGASFNPQFAHEITEALVALVRNQFLYPTHMELQIILQDQVDRRIAAKRRDKMKTNGFTMLSATETTNLQAESRHEVQEERQQLRSIDRILVKSEKAGKKKKVKSSVTEYDYSLKTDISLCINYDRYGVILRDELIVKAATDRWNRGAAEIVRALLAVALDDHSFLENQRTGTSVGVNEIVERIPHSSYPYLVAGIAGLSTKTIPEIVRQYLAVMSGDDLAVQPAAPFLNKVEANNPTYTVALEAICVKLRANLMMDLVRERLGNRAARVLATVAKAHKISEQSVRNCAMMPLKEARTHLADLQRLSLIETSEISKNPGLKRQTMTATSEHHHWAMDLPRAYNNLLASVYKTLGNILQRRAEERDKRNAASAREEQAYTRGADRTVLLHKDQEDLAELDDILLKTGLAELRCETIVFILRDLPGWPARIIPMR